MGWTWYNATHYKNGKIDRKYIKESGRYNAYKKLR